MPHQNRKSDPAALRGILGENLRLLASNYSSVASLCRELGINRTQFNRYLSGESFPRPDVLHRICMFLGVDARILLEPVGNQKPNPKNLLDHPYVTEFLGTGTNDISETVFPGGFYRFTRRSFVDSRKFITGLVYVKRIDGQVFIRGYEAKEAMRQQGLSQTPAAREFRGVVFPQEEGVAALIATRGALTSTFNFMSRVASLQNNYWEGFMTRNIRERLSDQRATRMVFEHLGNDRTMVFSAARKSGFCDVGDILPYHRRLLRIDEPFG